MYLGISGVGDFVSYRIFVAEMTVARMAPNVMAMSIE